MTKTEISAAIEEILPETKALRHELHRRPEIRFEEYWTSNRIVQALEDAGIAVVSGYGGGTGVVGEINGGRDRVIALRADMDGLEIQEETGLSYASEIAGRMHACGHDGHIAMLCGVASILAARVEQLDCAVRLIFQPGEEMGLGGRTLVGEGVLRGADAVFGMHGWPSIPTGRVGLKSGIAMAGADWFTIKVVGSGCHGADPAAGVNPIPAAARVVLGLQELATRRDDDPHPTALSVGSIHGGEAVNTIPETVDVAGSLRTLTPERRREMMAAITETALHNAERSGARALVVFDERSYAPLHNDPEACGFVHEALDAGLGADVFIDIATPSMASEDFAFYLHEVPGAFLWLGTAPDDREAPTLHSPHFDFNDDALATGIGVWLSLVAAFSKQKNVP